METADCYVAISCIAGFLAAFGISRSVLGKSGGIAKLFRRGNQKRNDSIVPPFMNAIRSFASPVTEKLVSFKTINEYTKNACIVLKSKWPYMNQGLLLSLMSCSLLFVFIVSGCLTASLLTAVIVVVCALLVFDARIKRLEEKNRDELREDLPDVLRSMQSCFNVGYSFPQVIEHVSLETKGQTKRIFEEAHDILRTGGSVDDALKCLRESSKDSEMMFLSLACEIQHKTGSSMRDVLNSLQDSLSQEVDLKRQLRSSTAQAQLSAQIVTIMPFLLLGLFSFISPGFMDAFFESVSGVVLFMVALLMQAAGVVIIRRLLKVEVL